MSRGRDARLHRLRCGGCTARSRQVAGARGSCGNLSRRPSITRSRCTGNRLSPSWAMVTAVFLRPRPPPCGFSVCPCTRSCPNRIRSGWSKPWHGPSAAPESAGPRRANRRSACATDARRPSLHPACDQRAMERLASTLSTTTPVRPLPRIGRQQARSAAIPVPARCQCDPGGVVQPGATTAWTLRPDGRRRGRAASAGERRAAMAQAARPRRRHRSNGGRSPW
jgi:hypothetical protein